VEGSSAPGVAGVDEGQLLTVQEVLQQFSIVPQGRLVQQPQHNSSHSEYYLLNCIKTVKNKMDDRYASYRYDNDYRIQTIKCRQCFQSQSVLLYSIFYYF
jgi:hypothetical protein